MIHPRPSFAASVLAGALALTACGTEPSAVGADVQPAASAPPRAMPMTAVASLNTATGQAAGTATATARDGSILISVSASGMTAGDHGIHVHTTGKCEGPKFETAGAHWNPTGAKHGLSNPQGQHSGDMPNLTVASDGTGTMEFTIEEAALDQMLDADGAALVIHAKADDQMTDPSGASGDRLACGVFRRG